MPLSAPTWTDSDTFALNGRVQLQWQSLAGAATYNVYRGGSLIKSGVPANLYIDFGPLANGTAFSYEVSGVDGSGVEGAKSAPNSLTPTALAGTNFRYRQTLGILLRYLIVTDGLPMLNAAFAQEQAAKGRAAPLIALSEPSVTYGLPYAAGEPTIAVSASGSEMGERMMGGENSFIFHSQVQFLLATPTGASFEVDDREFIGGAVMDNLFALLGNKANSRLPSLSPKTGNWMLPGCGVFRDCHPTASMRLNRPVSQEDKVTRAPCWTLLHEATIEVSQSDLML